MISSAHRIIFVTSRDEAVRMSATSPLARRFQSGSIISMPPQSLGKEGLCFDLQLTGDGDACLRLPDSLAFAGVVIASTPQAGDHDRQHHPLANVAKAGCLAHGLAGDLFVWHPGIRRQAAGLLFRLATRDGDASCKFGLNHWTAFWRNRRAHAAADQGHLPARWGLRYGGAR